MKKEKTCCIISNDFCNFNYLFLTKAKKEEINKKFSEALLKIKEKMGVTSFIMGLEEGAELLSAEQLLLNGDCSLECALAFEEQSSSYSHKERERFFTILEKCNKITLTSQKRDFGCKNKRDRYMIEKSDIVLCFWDKYSPYTGELLQYAAALDKAIYYI